MPYDPLVRWMLSLGNKFMLMDKVVTKDHNIPEKPAHRMLLLSFESSCKLVTNDHSIPEKTNTSNHMRCYYLLYHLANLLQMIIAYQKNQHITHTHVATIFVNHLANLLQKIIASQKTQHITHVATIFWNHLANLLQTIITSQKNQHITFSFRASGVALSVPFSPFSYALMVSYGCCYRPCDWSQF